MPCRRASGSASASQSARDTDGRPPSRAINSARSEDQPWPGARFSLAPGWPYACGWRERGRPQHMHCNPCSVLAHVVCWSSSSAPRSGSAHAGGRRPRTSRSRCIWQHRWRAASPGVKCGPRAQKAQRLGLPDAPPRPGRLALILRAQVQPVQQMGGFAKATGGPVVWEGNVDAVLVRVPRRSGQIGRGGGAVGHGPILPGLRSPSAMYGFWLTKRGARARPGVVFLMCA